MSHLKQELLSCSLKRNSLYFAFIFTSLENTTMTDFSDFAMTHHLALSSAEHLKKRVHSKACTAVQEPEKRI